MRKHRITDDDAEALVTGTAPAERPDLTPLARSITEFRAAAFAAPPRPSAELRSRLELAPASQVSTPAHPTEVAETIDARQPAAARPAASMGRMKRMFAWITGLGVAAKVVLGVSVAAAAGATGVGTAVGINTLVTVTAEQEEVAPDSTDVPTDPTDAPTDAPENFGDSVSDRAKELGADGTTTGAEFGAEVSGEAKLQGEGNAQNPDGTGADGSGSANVEGGVGVAPELPDVVPGGDD
jgi:hypothetical protein